MNLKKINIIVLSFLIVGNIFILSSCNKNTPKSTPAPAPTLKPKITIDLLGTVAASGSTALIPIVKQAAEDFIKDNPRLKINVSGGGSGTGIQYVKDGVVDIGNSDVFDDSSSELVDHQVAIIPFAFVVNKNVKVSNLTKEQLIGIFTGVIKNWKEVGGDNSKIFVVMRQVSSGTRKTIQDEVMGVNSFITDGVVAESNGEMKTIIAKTPNSIGYVDLAYVDESLKAINYNGISPTIENVNNKTYELTSIGHMYTKGEATGATKAFIKYMLSPDFQNNVLLEYKFAPIGK